jgi:hypothetical protein
MRKSIRLATILVAVVAVASVSFALAAVAASAGSSKSTTTLSIAGGVQLASSPFGPGANVTVTYSCFPGGKGAYHNTGFGSVGLVDLQAHQNFVGFGANCNDARHTLVVFVPGFFVAGGGAANASMCGFDCNFVSREVRIK